MAMSRPSAAGRCDDLAGDRDDVAEHRDTTAADRDNAAEQRDATAAERDEDTRRELATLDDRLLTVRQQINNHLTLVANSSADPATAPNPTRAGIRDQQELAAEQQRLAALDHAAVTRLVDELRSALQHLQDDRAETAADRWAAAGDRRQSGRDRDGSARDRASAAQDRDQAAIERAQDGSSQPTWIQDLPPGHEHPVSHTPQALSESRRRITASREQLNQARPTGPGHIRDEGG
jgi:hypothetical protein